MPLSNTSRLLVFNITNTQLNNTNLTKEEIIIDIKDKKTTV